MAKELAIAGIILEPLPGGMRRLTHPSGHVDEISAAAIVAARDELQQRIAAAQADLAAFDAQEAQIAAMEVADG